MVKNNVLDKLPIGDYLLMTDGVPYLCVDLLTGRCSPEVFYSGNAEAQLAHMAKEYFASYQKISRTAYRGRCPGGQPETLSIERITAENREALCVKTIAAILNKAANHDPNEDRLREAIMEQLDKLIPYLKELDENEEE